MSPEQTVVPVLEIAHVLFMDIVGYSKLTMDQQQRVLRILQDKVRSTSDFARAQEREQLIRLPTGDGMALVFFGDPEAAARCAMELNGLLKEHPEVPLRTGLHTGPVYRMADINANRNVSGGGINMAQRVMDCGDAGHILVSATAAEMLGQLSNWQDSLHDIGEAEVKHGMRVHLYNLYTKTAGNSSLPQKVALGRKSSSRPSGGVPGSPSDALIGMTIGHYRVLRALGAGGMGVVYEAEDTRLGRHVAIKFMPEHLVHDPLAMERFRREATLASGLNHPNICTLHDIGEESGQHFIVLELLEGENLKSRIEHRGAIPLEQLVEWGYQMADALDAAHSAGVVHRDIKPGNIFITKRDMVKIVDFGLAKQTGTSASAAAATGGTAMMTNPGTPLGTIAYMSPEQARGEELDARTDIFSFGVVLYEMATGKLPFGGTTTAVIFDSLLNKPAAPITSVDPNLPPALQKIIARALQKNRDARYASARQVRDDLKQLRGATTQVAVAAPARKHGFSLSGLFQMGPLKLKLAVSVATVAVAASVAWQFVGQKPGRLAQVSTAAPALGAAAETGASSAASPAAETAAEPTAVPQTAPSPAKPRPSAQAASQTAAQQPPLVAASPVTASPEARTATARTAPSVAAAPAAPPRPTPARHEASGGLSGQFSGRLRNTTRNQEAFATVSLVEQAGTVVGCLQVSPPLGGTGGGTGISTGSTLLLTTFYPGGKIEFRGQLSGDDLRGTYTAVDRDGRAETGSFSFSRRSAQGLPAGYDPSSCPK